jgi:hypothetical protein
MSSSSPSRRRGAAALGVVTVMPLVLFLVAVAGFALDWTHPAHDFGTGSTAGLGSSGVVLFVVGILGAGVLSMALLAFYIADAARNPAVAADHRAVWILVLLIGNALAFPAYWFVFWWRSGTAEAGRLGQATQ